MKGSSTVYIDETANEENRIVILQGSRTGRQKKELPLVFVLFLLEQEKKFGN